MWDRFPLRHSVAPPLWGGFGVWLPEIAFYRVALSFPERAFGGFPVAPVPLRFAAHSYTPISYFLPLTPYLYIDINAKTCYTFYRE